MVAQEGHVQLPFQFFKYVAADIANFRVGDNDALQPAWCVDGGGSVDMMQIKLPKDD